ncbi:MAG: hypothetical protein HY906_11085 [Deltaproteobacteria bacterium]|nr:hypothetical protein [Deltaproteobacteria bacterium]
MTRFSLCGSARVLVAALCGAAAAPALAADDPAEPTTPAAPPAGLGVLVALPGGILPSENAEVRRALDVYLHDFRPEVEEIGPLPGGMRAQIARTVEVARTRDVRLAVVLFWSAQTETRVLTATFVDLRTPDARPVKFTVDWPHQPDAAFYRLLGLKVRSTLLAIIGAPPGPGEGGPGAGRGRSRDTADGRLRFVLEGATALDIAIVSHAPVPSFGGALRLEYGRWGFGVTALRSLEERRTYPAAQGDTAATRLMAGASLRVARAWERLGFYATAQVGAINLRTTGRDLTTDEAHDYTQWVPVGSLGFLMGCDIGAHVRVLLGPRLDLFMARGWRTVQGTRVYDTGWVQPGLDLKVLILF